MLQSQLVMDPSSVERVNGKKRWGIGIGSHFKCSSMVGSVHAPSFTFFVTVLPQWKAEQIFLYVKIFYLRLVYK